MNVVPLNSHQVRPYAIVPSEYSHVHLLIDQLREGDRLEIAALGLKPLMSLRRSYRNSMMRTTMFINGKIAAMWGLGGNLLDDVGQPWLLTGSIIDTASPLLKVMLVKEVKREVSKMLMVKPKLVNYTHAKYAKAIGMLKLVGFEVGEPFPMQPHGELFCKFEMRGGLKWAS